MAVTQHSVVPRALLRQVQLGLGLGLEAGWLFAWSAVLGDTLAAEVATPLIGLPVLAADTTVVVAGEILGKPESAADAQYMLGKLSGCEHVVHTGIAVRATGATHVGLSSTAVHFAPLSREQIDAYWASGEPQGKAGAYAIQGLGAVFVTHIAGSYTAVMGLPLFETAQLLRRVGVPVWNGMLR